RTSSAITICLFRDRCGTDLPALTRDDCQRRTQSPTLDVFTNDVVVYTPSKRYARHTRSLPMQLENHLTSPDLTTDTVISMVLESVHADPGRTSNGGPAKGHGVFIVAKGVFRTRT